MIDLQKRRFTEQVKEIIPDSTSEKLTFQNDEVIGAKINYQGKLSLLQIKQLEGMAISWWFENFTIGRSGAGIVVEFNEFNPKAQG